MIRVFLPRCGVVRACSLRDKIRDPERYCSIFEQDGPPAFAPLSHTYGLLQPLVVDKFAQYSPLPGQNALEDVLLSHADGFGRPVRLCWPAADICDFAVRGRATSRVVGAFPCFAETRSPVFLDARLIGQSLRLVALLEGEIPLTVFLETTGTFVEDVASLEVSGTALFDPVGKVLRLYPCDVVVLSRLPMQRRDAPLPPLPTRPHGESSGPDEQGPDGPGPDICRPPRKQPRCHAGSGSSSGSRFDVPGDGALVDDMQQANATHGHCTLPVLLYDVAASFARTVDVADDARIALAVPGLVELACRRRSPAFDCVAPFSCAAVTWNPGFLITALSSRCREDTSANCFAECSMHWPHTRRQELAYRLALSAQHLPAIVHDGDEAAPPSYFVEHDPFQGPVGPHEDDAIEDDMTDTEPSMNCIEARIFCFQGPARSVSLWFHLAEQVREFLVRADILHNPDAEFLQLLPVMPHPDLPFMALLLVPRWWSAAGLTSALFVDGLAGGRCFLHTAHAVETFEDALPPALLQGSTAVSLFVPPRHTEELDPVHPDTLVSAAIASGSVVVVQGVHDEAPVYVDVLDHLQSLPHSTARHDDAEGRHDPHPASVVLLGVAFEQFILELRDGPTAAQVAAALDYPEECLYLHRQPACFERLVIVGVPVAESFGFRDTRVFGRVPGRGLFIDSRAVGRLVCYRCVQ